VHLNKRINEAKNSMKCDAIHRTHTHPQMEEFFTVHGETQHNRRNLLSSRALLRREADGTAFLGFPLTHTHAARKGKGNSCDKNKNFRQGNLICRVFDGELKGRTSRQGKGICELFSLGSRFQFEKQI
jgi:hypothetical protein